MLFLHGTTVRVKITFKENKNQTIQNPSQTYCIACMWGMGVNKDRKTGEKKLMIFERKMLRRIFGPKNNTENNEYERKTNAELK